MHSPSCHEIGEISNAGTAVGGSGRPRAITAADDKYLDLHAKSDGQKTVGETAKHMQRTTECTISRCAVTWRLDKGGMFVGRLLRCVPLTPSHRRRHILRCKE